MDEIKKRLIMKRPSERAVKLANVIYFTSIQEGEPYVYISLQQLCKLFDDCNEQNVKALITELLEELCEPIAVSDFTYNRKKIAWQAISFLSYEFSVENGQEYVDIELNQMFIAAMLQLEAEPFINFQ
ncbi:MAG: hypothetical protein WBF77_01260 [Sulfurimonadaceae bacterium]